MTTKKLPFKLPNFYMPWPARMNPHLQGARVQCKAWAYEVGILRTDGQGIWSEEAFDRMDFAYFAANTHPDAPPHELDLISNWYVWGWFVDDYFPQTFDAGKNDLGEAKAYLARLLSFMPKDLNTSTPEPENPAEYALANLWPRTAPTMSQGWRQRFVDHIQIMSEANLRELFNKDKNNKRMLDLVEYIKIRRAIGGIWWSADLVEHSLAAEIPPEIYHKRPIRVLNDVFRDVIDLRNDIISYQRDVAEGSLNNGVMVAQHFLNTELQEAVNFVNDLVTSRLYQFEHTMTVELPPLLDECQLNGEARQRVWLYVKALRDWIAGDLEWETRPGGRYIPAESKQESALGGPKGLGTVAARLGLSSASLGLRARSYNHVPFQTVGEIPFPEFYMPFPTELHPNLEEGRRTSKEWAYEMGMIGIPGVSVWDEQRFDAVDTALLCALIYPNASAHSYDLATKASVWGFYIDHHFTERYLSTRDIVGGRVFLARLFTLVSSSDSASVPVPTTPWERGLIDLWQRMATSMSIETRQQVRHILVECLEGWAWELDNQIYNRIPDPIDYMDIRIKTAGFEFLVVLNAIGKKSHELYENEAMRSLCKATGDAVCFSNDILSYQKEMESEGIVSNGVLITQHFLDCDLAKAVEIVNNLTTMRVREFEYVVTQELPALCDELQLDESDRAQMLEYVQELKFMMSGCLKWQLETRLYKESEFKRDPSPRNLFNVPTTLSPSVTRISSLLSPKIGISAPEIGSSSPVPSPEPILQNLLKGPTGLGTSANEIGSSSVPQPTKPSLEPILQNLLRGPTGLGTSATEIGSNSVQNVTDAEITANEIGSSSVPQPTEPSLEPIAQNLFRGPTGLGTSATEIGSSPVQNVTDAALTAQKLVNSLTKLGTETIQIRSLLGQQD